MSIRLGNIKGRTVYMDLPGLPDPVYIGLSARCFNQTGAQRAFTIRGEGTPWNFGAPTGIGNIKAGYNHRYNRDDFCYRAKPSAELTEEITLILEATGGYEDRKNVGIHFIDSEDGSWTVDENDNFDDGTKMGWTHDAGAGKNSSIVSAYAMSAPYSLNGSNTNPQWGAYETSTLYKAFNTPDKNQVFAIVYVRGYEQLNSYFRELEVYEGTTYRVELGWITGQYPIANDTGAGPPPDQWMKIVMPLTPNSAETISIRSTFWHYNAFGAISQLYIDSFKIRSKD